MEKDRQRGERAEKELRERAEKLIPFFLFMEEIHLFE